MSYIPNILSIFRLVIAPIFFIFLISQNRELLIYAYILYVIGAITDYLDGYLARKLHATSKFGNFLDPLADKFLTSFAFIAFVILEIIPLWMVLIVTFRDLFTTLIRVYKFDTKSGLITSKSAKWKTFLQMVFIFFILTFIFIYNTGIIVISQSFYQTVINSIYIDSIMFIITLISFWTLVDYVILIFYRPKNK